MATDLPALDPQADETARICNLLSLAAIPTRLKVLRALAAGDRDPAALAAACGLPPDAGLAGQLDLLRSGGLVEMGTVGDTTVSVTTPDGSAPRRTVYRITPMGRALVGAVRAAGAAVA
jgi:hypothetical protein